MSQSLIRSRLQRGRVPLVLFVILAILVGMRAHTAGAVGGLSIGPFLQEVTLQKGQAESTFPITVTNTTKAELPLRLTVVDFGAADEAGGINFLSDATDIEKRYGLASWIRLEKDVLVLKPGTSQQVKVTVENRASLSPGGHYGAVVFRLDTSANPDTIQPKVNFTKAVSTLVLAKKLGGEKHSLTLSSATWSGPPFALPREAKLRFLNNGNVHEVPRGDVIIRDTFGRVLRQGQLNEGSTIVLPESVRAYRVKLAEQKALWLPGWVTVTTRYRLSDTDPYTTSVSSFFIATPRSVFILLGIVVVGAVIIRQRKRIAHHTKHAARTSRAATKKAVKHIAARRAKKKARRPSSKHKH